MSPIIPENPIYCEYCGEEIIDENYWESEYCGEEIIDENYWESEYDGELYPIHDHCFRDYVVENIGNIQIAAKRLSTLLKQDKLGDLEYFAGQCHKSADIIMDYCEKKRV